MRDFLLSLPGLPPADASAQKVYGTEMYIDAYRLMLEVVGRSGYVKRGSPGAVLNGVLHALGKVRRGRLGSGGERFELRACAVEDGVQGGSVGASLDALLRALDCGFVHARQR